MNSWPKLLEARRSGKRKLLIGGKVIQVTWILVDSEDLFVYFDVWLSPGLE